MIKRCHILVLRLCLWPGMAPATPLVADLSNYRIDVDSSFNGTRLFLFGARNDNGDIVVVIRGPHKNYMVRRKEEIAGVWVNRERMKFFNVPDFYAIATSKPLEEIAEHGIFDRMGIGEQHLLSPPSGLNDPDKFDDFSQAFLDYQRTRRLYYTDAMGVSFMGETLFKTTIEFPDNIPPGNYTAEIFLVSDGDIIGMQSTPIKVVKTGLDAFLYNYAHTSPVLYGISAVLLALSAGWVAGRLFEKS